MADEPDMNVHCLINVEQEERVGVSVCKKKLWGLWSKWDVSSDTLSVQEGTPRTDTD
jgi:hypothetical protein